VQDLGRAYAEEAKTAYETLTADLKDLAAVKSPAELFQLQGKLARRNFDALVAYGSKNTDAAIKLASESFAPISGRLSLAAEMVAKAA
jgi:phasin family protein